MSLGLSAPLHENGEKCIYLQYEHLQSIFSIAIFPWIYFNPDFSISSFIFHFQRGSVHYFMPFRNIYCSNITIWCNKNNQHFTVTHNSHSFCRSTNSGFPKLLATYLCTFIIPLKDISLIFPVCCHPSLYPRHSHTIVY